MTTTVAIDIEELENLRSSRKCPITRGQYEIVPDGAKKPELYQRVSNLIKVLDDRYRLELHQQRQVAMGIAARDDLRARVAACRPDDKHDLDELCKQAKEAAKGTARANFGTALHAFSERIDMGEITTADIPAEWRDDIVAYLEARDAAGIQVLGVEDCVVLNGLRVAGTRDSLLDFGSVPCIGDLKTGDDLSWSAGSIAMQLACYANADTIYDPVGKKHTPTGDIDRQHAIVFHVPFGQGRCDLYTVDIAEGWEAVKQAVWVKQWRNRCKGLLDRWDDHTPSPHPHVRRARLLERAQTLPRDQLAAAWPAGVPTFKQAATHTGDQLDLIAMAISTIENRNQAAFATPDPADI